MIHGTATNSVNSSTATTIHIPVGQLPRNVIRCTRFFEPT